MKNLLISILLFNSLFLYGQNSQGIMDFYEYANADWLKSTTIPENDVVVNNWGILWDDIISKSIEILSPDSNYGIDEDHQFVLMQLRKLYKSTSEKFENDRKRVEFIQEQFPTLFGILFSKITISELKENRINDLIKYLKEAYRIKIIDSDKIGNKYKNLFISKLDKMEFKVGAPILSDFSKMPIMDPNNYDGNIQLSKDYKSKIKRIKHNWVVPPFETYCAYNFIENNVKIHAGILFDNQLDKEDNYAYMYATIGRTIAHEMTHAFDIVGRNYDADGKRINKIFSGLRFDKNEWDNIYSDLIEQYDQYTIQDSLHVNGKVTLQENIADIGGVEVSLLALKLKLNDKKYSEVKIDKYIEDYFIEFARFWREIVTEEFERETITRAHTPQKYRAIGPIYNQNEFYNLFNIDKNSKYFISIGKRVSIW